MPLAFQTQRVSLGATAYFHFDDTIALGNYVVGSWMFSLYYPNLTAHNVRSLSMSLSHGYHDQQTIYVTVNGNMVDDHNNTADPGSGCEVVVIAWVGSNDTPTVVMENVTGVSQSSPYIFDIPPNALQVYTFLSGINLVLSGEQGVTSYGGNCAANIDPINKRVNITGDATLNGNHGTVDVGFLVLTADTAPFQIVTATEPSDGNFYNIPFPKSITNACPLITSFSGDFHGGPVVLMSAQAAIFINDPPPVNEVSAGFTVDIVSKTNGTENGNLNATLIGLNSTTSLERPNLPAFQNKLISPKA